jgi:hypothetical protein
MTRAPQLEWNWLIQGLEGGWSWAFLGLSSGNGSRPPCLLKKEDHEGAVFEDGFSTKKNEEDGVILPTRCCQAGQSITQNVNVGSPALGLFSQIGPLSSHY